MAFNDILGHKRTIDRIKTLILSGRVPPALMFSGTEGIGKFLAAKEFAKALNCTHIPMQDTPSGGEADLFGGDAAPPLTAGEPGDACDKCVSCSQINKGVHPDVRVIDSDFQGFLLDEDSQKQRTLKIDTVREFSRYVYQKASLSPWKVFIINDAHTLNLNAQNAMLKILEEPPANTVFVLVAAKKNLFLPTIISRSHAIDFKKLPAECVAELLERSGIPQDEAAALAPLSDGSVKKAADIRKVRGRLSGITATGAQRIFKLVSSLPREPYMAREEAKIMLDMLILSARSKWLAAGPEKTAGPYSGLIKKLLELRKFLNQNVSQGLVLETALLESDKLSVTLKA